VEVLAERQGPPPATTQLVPLAISPIDPRG